MRAGRLRHRVALQVPTDVGSVVDGSVLPTWATAATFWANELPQGAREFVLAQQRDGELTNIFSCRHRTDVTLKKRLLWGGRIFDIRGYWNPDSRKRELLISCREAQP